MTYSAFNAKPKVDLYQKVTDQIIAELEAGTLPWVRPWNSAGLESAAMPMNAISKRRYSGINVLLLWSTSNARGFTSNLWLTYKQAAEKGGFVRKGEKGTEVYYSSKFLPKLKPGQIEEEIRAIWFLKSYTVFNIDQCDGLNIVKPVMPTNDIERHDMAETVIKGTHAAMAVGTRAYYTPSTDIVTMPPIQSFPDTLDFYRTAFHELAHWTGAKGRCERVLKGKFGDPIYAFEELIAELSSAFTGAACGINPTNQHASYIKSWLQGLQDDKTFIFKAASLASKATDFILGESAEESDQA